MSLLIPDSFFRLHKTVPFSKENQRPGASSKIRIHWKLIHKETTTYLLSRNGNTSSRSTNSFSAESAFFGFSECSDKEDDDFFQDSSSPWYCRRIHRFSQQPDNKTNSIRNTIEEFGKQTSLTFDGFERVAISLASYFCASHRNEHRKGFATSNHGRSASSAQTNHHCTRARPKVQRNQSGREPFNYKKIQLECFEQRKILKFHQNIHIII